MDSTKGGGQRHAWEWPSGSEWADSLLGGPVGLRVAPHHNLNPKTINIDSMVKTEMYFYFDSQSEGSPPCHEENSTSIMHITSKP